MKKTNNYILAFSIAIKELFYNKLSTSLIILVVASICLPLILLTSIKEGYVEHMRNNILDATDALRVDVSVYDSNNYEAFFNKNKLASFRMNKHISEIVPSRSPRDIKIINKKGNTSDFQMLATQPTDPELNRKGFKGKFGDEEIARELNIIIHDEDLKELQYDTVNNKIQIAIKGRIIPCNIMGTFSKGKTGTVYIPLSMEDKLERWAVGFSVVFDKVTPPVTLPSSKDKEDALEQPLVDTIFLYTDLLLKKLAKSYIENLDYSIEQNSNYRIKSLAQYLVTNNSGQFSKDDAELIESAVSNSSKVAIMDAPSLEVDFKGKSIKLIPSSTNDIRENFILAQDKGQWLNSFRNKFEVVLPPGILDLGEEYEMQLNNSQVRFKCVGLTKDQFTDGYIDQATLLRLNQVSQGKADLVGYKYFQPTGETDYESRYLYARVHANSLEEVANVVELFNSSGYRIERSKVNAVKDLQAVNSQFSKFTNLINAFGLIACIVAIFVLMYEAIKRKDKQIGIMRAMGLSSSFINISLIIQSIFYSVSGLLLSLIIYWGLKSAFDNKVGHGFLSLQGIDGSLTKLSFSIFLMFFIGMISIAVIAGYSVTRRIHNINPADILAD